MKIHMIFRDAVDIGDHSLLVSVEAKHALIPDTVHIQGFRTEMSRRGQVT